MTNYFSDNADLVFQFERFDLREPFELLERGYAYSGQYAEAPADYRDAMDNCRKVLELVGDISGNSIAERAASVDDEGATFHDGRVEYAAGTRKNLADLTSAELMGLILPHEYGGLNLPFSLYCMAIEVVGRADASLVNLFGLQDIGDCINKFADDEVRADFLPRLASGEHTGAMALTEPDAGSDLQAVKLQAYQDESGRWRLRGVKRFITNGGAGALLVLARSEPGSADGRGLSLFACHGGDSVKVRRIENKLGIHGSPTCELEFRDTPAFLVGRRKFGLVKYVLDLMFRARMGISAQALGISQQAYELALRYAKERKQFGKPIYELPVIANMLVDMRVQIETSRSLFYYSAQQIDLKEQLERKLERLKAEGQSVTDVAARVKKLVRMANLLTPLCKYLLSETANRITYDALQIHGGAGYMREFAIERLARDARITNIYEGTSQMQIVAAMGSVVTDAMADFFAEKVQKGYKGALATLAGYLEEARALFKETMHFVLERKNATFQDLAARDLVELYAFSLIGYLVLDEAEADPHKLLVAKRYIVSGLPLARKNAENIQHGALSDLLHADEILN